MDTSAEYKHPLYGEEQAADNYDVDYNKPAAAYGGPTAAYPPAFGAKYSAAGQAGHTATPETGYYGGNTSFEGKQKKDDTFV